MQIRYIAAAAACVLALTGGVAQAQTKLKFGHVYETSEPYHTEAVWAAGEIAKRTNNKYQIDVFAASALGNEQQINQALPLGTIDIIYTGIAFAASTYKPIGISNAPYMFRDFDHWKAYSDSALFKELAGGYDKASGNKVVALTYYGARHMTANKPINSPGDLKGMKVRVPQAPLYVMFTRAMGANATPIAFAEVYLALQQGTVDGQENPLPTIQAKKFYEVQSHISLTNHIVESLVTVIGGPLWNKLNPQERQTFEEVFKQAATRASTSIRESEQKLPEWFQAQGKTVVKPDLGPFREMAAKLHNDPAAGAGWTKEQYDQLQKIAAKTN